ncbi:MarR family winged helix-turn-helix transcriptional regulator [Actinoplanes sp. NPDC051494]|uniref:MarR family winged helix-turn-helix transcriptional regulator n=1 Tax=Actinoplanes sp. NPDC051494 TaxID=3363907 RepID=UPI00379D9AC3
MSQDRGAALYDVLRHVRPLVLNSARVVEVSLRPAGLSVGSRAVLEILDDHGPATVPAIGDRLDLPRQGVQRHINDLIALGHVTTHHNPAHRRSSLVSLTAAGAAAIAGVRTDELRHLAGMAQDCTDEEITAARKVLRALNRDVRRRAQTKEDPHDPRVDHGQPAGDR